MTINPTPTWEEAITEILDNFRHGVVVDCAGGMIKSGSKDEAIKKSIGYQSEASAAINKAVLELVIGEPTDPYDDLKRRSELRAAQRRVVRGDDE